MQHRSTWLRRAARRTAVPAAVALIAPLSVHAALGAPERSVHADASALAATHAASDLGTYRLHEMQASSGTIVHEYASPDGTIFAVTWRGQRMPNLQQLLGDHYAPYAAAASREAQPGHRHHLLIHSGDLVVENSGHMRAFAGRAYLKSAVPSGVALEALR